MIDLKSYGYTEIEVVPGKLLPGRSERFKVMIERGDVIVVLREAAMRCKQTKKNGGGKK